MLHFGHSVPHITSEPGGWGWNYALSLDLIALDQFHAKYMLEVNNATHYIYISKTWSSHLKVKNFFTVL